MFSNKNFQTMISVQKKVLKLQNPFQPNLNFVGFSIRLTVQTTMLSVSLNAVSLLASFDMAYPFMGLFMIMGGITFFKVVKTLDQLKE